MDGSFEKDDSFGISDRQGEKANNERNADVVFSSRNTRRSEHCWLFGFDCVNWVFSSNSFRRPLCPSIENQMKCDRPLTPCCSCRTRARPCTKSKRSAWTRSARPTICPSTRTKVIDSFTEFYRLLPTFTVFDRVLPSFSEFYRHLQGFYRVLPSFTNSFTEFYQLFYRVLPTLLPTSTELYRL